MAALVSDGSAKRARIFWSVAFVLSMGLVGGLLDSVHLSPVAAFAVAMVPMLMLFPLVRSVERAQAQSGCVTPATIRYNRRILVMSLGYLVALFIAIDGTRHWGATGVMLWVLALLPTLPVTGMIVTIGLLLVEETDEYQRMRTVRASLVATGILLIAGTLWGFLEMFGLVSHLWLWWVFPVWAIGLGIGQLANRWVFGQSGY